MSDDPLARGSDANNIAAAEKLKFFSEHVRGVLTLSSAAVPAIVGVFGLLFRKDATGAETLPPFARTWLILPALAVLSFLISILAGVTTATTYARKPITWKCACPGSTLHPWLCTSSSPLEYCFFRRGLS